MTRSRTIACFVAAGVLAGCSTDSPLKPSVPELSRNAASNPIDVSGVWISTTRNKVLHLSEFAAPMFGFQPEGVRTTIRCDMTGTLNLVQTGVTLSGTWTETGTCESLRGQVVALNGAGPIVDGSVRGQSVHLVSIAEPGVECISHAAAQEVVGGVAQRLHGTFSCIEPGHPQSTLPLPGPRMGPNRTVFEAVRP